MALKLAPEYPDSPEPNSFELGLEFQDLVCCELGKRGIVLQNLGSKRYQLSTGENIQGFEIKLDRRFLETGRLSIEIAEKSKASMAAWTPSGIYRSDNTWLYIQGNERRLYVFSKKLLVGLHKRRDPATGRPFYTEGESHGTVKKFYLPLRDAEKYCAMRIELKR